MGHDVALVQFLDTNYLPEHKHIPGYLSIRCLIKEWGWREKKASYTFQYYPDEKKVFFRAYPVQVQLLIGEATNLEEAIEQAKQFLTKWLGDDLEFRLKTAQEIRRLEEGKRSI